MLFQCITLTPFVLGDIFISKDVKMKNTKIVQKNIDELVIIKIIITWLVLPPITWFIYMAIAFTLLFTDAPGGADQTLFWIVIAAIFVYICFRLYLALRFKDSLVVRNAWLTVVVTIIIVTAQSLIFR